MKVEKSRLKKGTSEVPIECQQLIDRLSQCDRQELIIELSKIETWTFGKCELYHWIDILDIFDGILEEAAQSKDTNEWLLNCDINFSQKDLKLLLLVLNFTTLLIEHSFSRHLYNSIEHLTKLLSSSNMDIVLDVLNLFYMFSKRSNFISRLSCAKKDSLLTRLNHIAESWGGKDYGFSLANCCRTNTILPKSASTFFYEYYNSNGSLDTIEYPDVNSVTEYKTASEFTKAICKNLENLNEDQKMHIFTRLRLALSFINYPARLQFVQARLQALSVLVYSNSLQDNIHPLLYPGFLEELVELLELKEVHLVEIRAAALRTLTSIIHLDRNPHFPKKSGSRLGMIIDVTGASSYHGFLPTLVRTCIQTLTSSTHSLANIHSKQTMEFPLPLATALFSFLYHLASYEMGGESLVACGMMESLLRVINWPGFELEHITFVTRAVRVIDLITNIEMQSFQNHNGLDSFIGRLDMEVNYCRREQPFEIEPITDVKLEPLSNPDQSLTHTNHNNGDDEFSYLDDTIMSADASIAADNDEKSKLDKFTPLLKTCLPQRAALLKSMLNFLKKAIQDQAFSDSIRHVMEGTLPSSLRHIISNAEYYGPSLFLLATDVVTVYVFQEPSLLSSLQDNGLTDVVLQALLKKDVPATREVLGSLPNVFSALCLNSRGLQAFGKYDPFERLFKVLLSPAYLMAMRRRRSNEPMGDTASNLGNAMDELMRHQPTLKPEATKAIIKLLEELVNLGTDPKYICWRAGNKNDSTQLPQSHNNNNSNQRSVNRSVQNRNGNAGGNAAGSSDEDDDDEEEASTSSHQREERLVNDMANNKSNASESAAGGTTSTTLDSDDGSTERTADRKREPIPLIDYVLNVMKFVDAILSNNATDDHCREFVQHKGLEPLLSILALPNLPVDSPITTSAQAVAAVCKSILNLAHEPEVLQVALDQLSTVVDKLQSLQVHIENPGGSVLLRELANCPNIESAFSNASYTPLLHAMSAVHGYIVMLVHICRTGQSEIRTILLVKWGQMNKLLTNLVQLYTALVWESTLLLALCTDDVFPSDCEFGKEDIEKLPTGCSDDTSNGNNVASTAGQSGAPSTDVEMNTNANENSMELDDISTPATFAASLATFSNAVSEDNTSTSNTLNATNKKKKLIATAGQLRYIKALLGASSRLGRALAELFGNLVKLCVGSPLRQRRGQNYPPTPAYTSKEAKDIARVLSYILVDGFSYEKLSPSPIPKLKLTFLICSVGFTGPMLFDEKRYAFHLMLHQFVREGGLMAFFDMFEWALASGMPENRSAESDELEGRKFPDGTGEFLDAWLMLLEKMVNPKAILESPHVINPRSSSSGGNINNRLKSEFDAVLYLVTIHRLAFGAVTKIWGRKPLRTYGVRMTESMMSILKHIIKSEKLIKEKYKKRIIEIKEAEKIAKHLIMQLESHTNNGTNSDNGNNDIGNGNSAASTSSVSNTSFNTTDNTVDMETPNSDHILYISSSFLDSIVTNNTPSNNRPAALPTNTEGNLTADQSQQLRDMGFSEMHVTEAMMLTSTLIEATEYLLNHPPLFSSVDSLLIENNSTNHAVPPPPPQSTNNVVELSAANRPAIVRRPNRTSSSSSTSRATVGNTNSGDVRPLTRIRSAILNSPTATAPHQPTKLSTKKQLPTSANQQGNCLKYMRRYQITTDLPLRESRIDEFCDTAIDKSLFLMDELPDTVTKGTDLLVVLYRRNPLGWRNYFLIKIVKELCAWIDFIRKQIRVNDNNVRDIMLVGEGAQKFYVRLHLCCLLMDDIYPDMRESICKTINDYNVLSKLICLLSEIELLLRKRQKRQNPQRKITPKWLAQMVIFMDLVQKVNLYIQSKHNMLDVTTRVWKWYDINTGKWNAYSTSNNKVIDYAYVYGEPSIRITCGRQRYTINFNCMSQVNEETGNHRPVILALKATEKNNERTSTPTSSPLGVVNRKANNSSNTTATTENIQSNCASASATCNVTATTSSPSVSTTIATTTTTNTTQQPQRSEQTLIAASDESTTSEDIELCSYSESELTTSDDNECEIDANIHDYSKVTAPCAGGISAENDDTPPLPGRKKIYEPPSTSVFSNCESPTAASAAGASATGASTETNSSRIQIDTTPVGLFQYNTGEIVALCVKLMQPQIGIDRDAFHAIMKLCVRLTKNFENAKVFAQEGGVRLLLTMRQSCGYMGFPTFAILLIRHVLEEPKSLALAMERVIAGRTMPVISPGYRDLVFLLRQMSAAVCRDPQIFKDVAQQILRIDLLSFVRRNQTNEDNRLIVKSSPVSTIKRAEKMIEPVSVAAVHDLLKALIQPCVHYTTKNVSPASSSTTTTTENICQPMTTSQNTYQVLPGGGFIARNVSRAQQLHNLSSNSGAGEGPATNNIENSSDQCCGWHIPSPTHVHDKPLLPRATILKFLADAVRSYQTFAPLITEHIFKPEDSPLVQEKQTALSFILDKFLPLGEHLFDREVSSMCRVLIAALASCTDQIAVQTTVIIEVKLAINRALAKPESTEKHLHIQILTGLIPTMIDNCPPDNTALLKLHQLQSNRNEIFIIMIRKGIITDLAKLVQYLDLSSPHTISTINATLKPLESLLRMTNAPGTMSITSKKQPQNQNPSQARRNLFNVGGGIVDVISIGNGNNNVGSGSHHHHPHHHEHNSSRTAGSNHDLDENVEDIQTVAENLVRAAADGDQANLEDIVDQLLERASHIDNNRAVGQIMNSNSASVRRAVHEFFGDSSSTESGDSDSNGSDNEERTIDDEEDNEEEIEDRSELDVDEETRQFIEIYDHVYGRHLSPSIPELERDSDAILMMRFPESGAGNSVSPELTQSTSESVVQTVPPVSTSTTEATTDSTVTATNSNVSQFFGASDLLTNNNVQTANPSTEEPDTSSDDSNVSVDLSLPSTITTAADAAVDNLVDLYTPNAPESQHLDDHLMRLRYTSDESYRLEMTSPPVENAPTNSGSADFVTLPSVTPFSIENSSLEMSISNNSNATNQVIESAESGNEPASGGTESINLTTNSSPLILQHLLYNSSNTNTNSMNNFESDRAATSGNSEGVFNETFLNEGEIEEVTNATNAPNSNDGVAIPNGDNLSNNSSAINSNAANITGAGAATNTTSNLFRDATRAVLMDNAWTMHGIFANTGSMDLVGQSGYLLGRSLAATLSSTPTTVSSTPTSLHWWLEESKSLGMESQSDICLTTAHQLIPDLEEQKELELSKCRGKKKRKDITTTTNVTGTQPTVATSSFSTVSAAADRRIESAVSSLSRAINNIVRRSSADNELNIVTLANNVEQEQQQTMETDEQNEPSTPTNLNIEQANNSNDNARNFVFGMDTDTSADITIVSSDITVTVRPTARNGSTSDPATAPTSQPNEEINPPTNSVAAVRTGETDTISNTSHEEEEDEEDEEEYDEDEGDDEDDDEEENDENEVDEDQPMVQNSSETETSSEIDVVSPMRPRDPFMYNTQSNPILITYAADQPNEVLPPGAERSMNNDQLRQIRLRNRNPELEFLGVQTLSPSPDSSGNDSSIDGDDTSGETPGFYINALSSTQRLRISPRSRRIMFVPRPPSNSTSRDNRSNEFQERNASQAIPSRLERATVNHDGVLPSTITSEILSLNQENTATTSSTSGDNTAPSSSNQTMVTEDHSNSAIQMSNLPTEVSNHVEILQSTVNTISNNSTVTATAAEPETSMAVSAETVNLSSNAVVVEMSPEVREALGDLEVPEGVDPSFLAALPQEMREEVISEHLRLQRVRQRAQQQASQQVEHAVVAEVNPEFLAALPPNIQEEVLAQQRIEQQRQVAATANPNDPVDAAAFFQNLPMNLRQAILTDMEDSQISVLPPELATEAQNLRRDWENRNRQMMHDRLINQIGSNSSTNNVSSMRYLYRNPRFPPIHNLSVRPRWNTPTNWGGGAAGNSGPTGPNANCNVPHINQLSTPSLMTLMERQGRPLLDHEALSSLLVLLFIDEPKFNTLRLHRVIRNLCCHVPTREWIIKSLLSIIEKTNNGLHNKQSSSSVINKNAVKSWPQWLTLRLDGALGSRANVFVINRDIKTNGPSCSSGFSTEGFSISIHPQASPIVCKHTLDLLIALAKSFPKNFLPFYKDNLSSIYENSAAASGSSTSSATTKENESVNNKKKPTETVGTNNSDIDKSVVIDLTATSDSDSSTINSPEVKKSTASSIEKSTDFWDIIMKLDFQAQNRRANGPQQQPISIALAGTCNGPKQSQFNKDFVSFKESPFGQLISMLSYEIIKKTPQLTDKLLRLLSFISVGLPNQHLNNLQSSPAKGTTNQNTSEEIRPNTQQSPPPPPPFDRKLTKETGAIKKRKIEPQNLHSELLPTTESQLRLAIEVLTAKSCSEEGLEDATSLLLNMSQCSNQTRTIILNLLVRGAKELSQMIQQQIVDLMTELNNVAIKQARSNDTSPDDQQATTSTDTSLFRSWNSLLSKPKGMLQDRFTRENVVITAPSRLKQACELQLTSMVPLILKNSAQAFFLRILKVIIQIREAVRDAHSRKNYRGQIVLGQIDTALLSEIIQINDFWDTLSECLLQLEHSADNNAVLVLQPAVEAFFLLHASPQKPATKKSPSGECREQENSNSTGMSAASSSQDADSNPNVEAVGISDEVNADAMSTDEQQMSPNAMDQDEPLFSNNDEKTAEKNSPITAGLASSSPIVMTYDQKKFLEFAEKHRTVLNQILRQSTTHLSDGPFAVLVDHTRILDFDVKRRYFRTELERLDEGIRREELAVHVHRVTVFEDSFRELYRRNPEEWKNRFYIVFEDEEGQDAGGLLREWYVIISREIFNPMYALFTVSPGDRVTYMINSSSHANPNHLCYYKFVGRVIAKAIYDNKLLECYFTRSFYKHILGIGVKYTDMESEDYEFYKGLVFLLENEVSALGYDLTFSLEVQEFGVTEIKDLIPNGRNIAVNNSNKLEYIHLVCQLKMFNAIKQQLKAFLDGFYDIIPKRLISIFNEQELELLISGLPNVDIEDLRANTEYHKYQTGSIQIQWFWRALRSFDQAERAKFLQFVTGTSKVPLQGFAALEGMNGVQKFQIHRDDRSTDRLPSAHTCFNQLDLPVYKTYDKLRSSLLKAIHECSEGFGFA